MSLAEKFTIIIPPQDIAINPGCLRRLSEGDRQAFQWLYKNYSRKVYDYALLMTGDIHLSEDIVQEVFLKIWMHRAKMQSINNFNGYIHIIVRNYTLSHLQGQEREECSLREYGRFKQVTTSVIQESIENKEREQIIKEGIRQLPPRQQLAYTLRREHGWKRERIAKELNISPFTVKGHIQQAIKSICNYVSKRIEN